MIDPQEYYLGSSTNPMEEKIAHIFEIYRKEMFKAMRWTSTICCWRRCGC
jgi:hypothetical protein